jgi:hypothetical protein
MMLPPVPKEVLEMQEHLRLRQIENTTFVRYVWEIRDEDNVVVYIHQEHAQFISRSRG